MRHPQVRMRLGTANGVSISALNFEPLPDPPPSAVSPTSPGNRQEALTGFRLGCGFWEQSGTWSQLGQRGVLRASFGLMATSITTGCPIYYPSLPSLGTAPEDPGALGIGPQ